MKRLVILTGAAALLAGVAVVAFQHLWEPGAGQRAAPVTEHAAQIRQGAYLARAGNCMACHTAQDGAAYAGGKALATPFGTMYGPNLTPDSATGIGSWSADDLWRAMHNGKSKDGGLLYPAFPYPNYTKVTRADSDALYAFLRTLTPVRQANREHELRFPYNQRGLLAFWRTLYFAPGEFRQQPQKGVQWNRGAYLVQGLGHCSACHAEKNALGASLAADRLGGGKVGAQGWQASPLGGERDVLELAELLQTGVSERHAVYGPMAEVVAASLQHLAPGDIHAISAYLATLPGTPIPAPGAAPSDAVLRQGEKIYAKQCASCHGEQGEGAPRAYPRLAGRGAFDTGNAARMVFHGGYAPATAGNPRPYGMPPFSGVLSNGEVAAVISYINRSWGNQGPLVLPHDVERLRGGE
jgi:mono/diheme cytochrome c family protein